MRRATMLDCSAIAAIINAPSVRPFVGGDGESFFDPADIIADEKNVLLFDEGGGQLFHWRGPEIYEMHSFYLVRGKEALARGRESVARMFGEHGAGIIWGATPIENRRARWFNRRIGFRSRGEAEVYGRCELFEMKDAPCL